MRLDLTETEIRSLLQRLDRIAARQEPLPVELVIKVRRLAGEVRELRDREANVAFMAGIEGSY